MVLLTGEIAETEVIEAIRLGAKGLVLKEMAPSLLVQCLRKIQAGGEWFERGSFNRAMEKMLRERQALEKAKQLLTDREIEIVRMVAKDLRNVEIGERLCISEGTVKRHLVNIFNKLGIERRAQLIRCAQKGGLA